jgi:hypothetical protein
MSLVHAQARDDAAASTASLPYVRDDRDTPLPRAGMTRDKQMIWVRREQQYFSVAGWTMEISLILLRKKLRPKISYGC